MFNRGLPFRTDPLHKWRLHLNENTYTIIILPIIAWFGGSVIWEQQERRREKKIQPLSRSSVLYCCILFEFVLFFPILSSFFLLPKPLEEAIVRHT